MKLETIQYSWPGRHASAQCLTQHAQSQVDMLGGEAYNNKISNIKANNSLNGSFKGTT